MKGIILAGGSGSRLFPLTAVTSKQLLPVYDKPMIYYPLSVLMTAGIQDIMIISTPQDIGKFERLLGTGKHLGISLTYRVQPRPEGLAQAFIIAEDFIGDDNVAMILGDNIFILHDKIVKQMKDIKPTGATVFACQVPDARRFGVIEFENGAAVSIEEKPTNPKSDYCVTGLYFYDNRVVQYAKELKPSARGELEITDINNRYLKDGELNVIPLVNCYWIDAGTFDSLFEASSYVKSMQDYLRKEVANLQEIGYNNKWIGVKK